MGVGGAVGAVIFQALLLANPMAVREEVVYVSAPISPCGRWIVLTGVLGRGGGLLPGSMPVLILAAIYFGYPLWACRLAKRARERESSSSAA